MGAGFRRTALPPIKRLFCTGTAVGLSDAQLLERFLEGHDEGAESAFNVLVERHGPMVLAVCGRVLRDPHDAQDAFQATFLVLVRKAGAIHKRESIADWLHGVARRVSARARADLARRRSVERRAVTRTLITYQPSRPEVDARDEVEHLPHDLRAPVVLCYLQGLTHEQTARQLGWPVGTVRSRLARARSRLRADLRRRGIAPDAAILPMLALERLSLPEQLIDTTVKAAMLLTARDAGEAGLISASAVALAEGVLRTMLVSKIKLTAVILVAVGIIGSGVGLCAYQGVGPGAAPAGVKSDEVPKAVEPGALPKGVEQGALPKGVEPGALPKGVQPGALPKGVEPGALPKGAQPGALPKGVESRAMTGVAATIPPADFDSGMRSGDDLDDYAARVQELVQRARREQAVGDWEAAVRNLAKSVMAADEWQEALMKRRRSERNAPPFSPKRDPEALPRQSGTDSSGTAARRLDDLERKVDRILSALEKNGHDQAERPKPARNDREPIQEHPQNYEKPAGVPAHPRAEPETDADEQLTGDLGRIQGAWKGKTGTDGYFQTVETFKGKTGRTENTAPDGNEFGLVYRFEIDEHAKPHKRIHIYDIARYGTDSGGPKEVHGLYTFIDDNTIMFCNRFDGKYPAAFGNSPSSLMYTMKREPAVQKPAR
jgi:RNA polymerase sigma factor (sigma-70 family)